MSKKRYTTEAEKRLDEATRWFVILQQPDLSPRALEAWKRWESITENRQLFDELERLWSALGEVEPPAMPSLAATATDGYDGSESIATWNERTRAHTYERPAPVQRVESRRFWFVALAATVIICVAMGLLAWKHQQTSLQARVDVFETAVGQHKEIALNDGSHIQLGARSSVSVTMSEHFRTVVLNSGEALFTVAHDTSRPFNVLAGNGTITAVGTAFNVRRREDDHVVVTVTEGTVQITNTTDENPMQRDATQISVSTPPLRLEHGNEISYGIDGSFSKPRRADDDTVTWRSGRLHYRQEPLRNVIPDINRYSHRPIVIGDRAAGELLFTGTVFERDVDEWIDNLESVYPFLEVTVTDADNVLVRTRPLTTNK
jgi:transmembrane sensor